MLKFPLPYWHSQMLFWRASPRAMTPGRFITITTPTCLSHLPWKLRGQHWSHFQSSLFSPANPTSPAQPGQPGATAKNSTNILLSPCMETRLPQRPQQPHRSCAVSSHFTSTMSAVSCHFQLLLDLADSSDSSVDGKAAAVSTTQESSSLREPCFKACSGDG